MKCMLVVAFSAVLLAVVSAKTCTDSGDCEDGQCCAGFMPFRGTCKVMTKEGGKCLINKAIFPFNEIYIVACPCEEGLECTKVEGKKNKNNGVCQPPPTTAEPETTEPAEVTTEGEEVTTGGGSGEVTKDGSGEVTTGGGSGEVTKDGSGEVTKDDSGDDTTTEGEVTTEEDKEVTEEEKVTDEVTEKEVVTEGEKEAKEE